MDAGCVPKGKMRLSVCRCLFLKLGQDVMLGVSFSGQIAWINLRAYGAGAKTLSVSISSRPASCTRASIEVNTGHKVRMTLSKCNCN